MTRMVSGIAPFFIVADVPETLSFYRDMLGLKLRFVVAMERRSCSRRSVRSATAKKSKLKSYRTMDPLRVIGEITDWKGYSSEELKAMNDHLEQLRQQGVEAIED